MLVGEILIKTISAFAGVLEELCNKGPRTKMGTSTAIDSAAALIIYAPCLSLVVHRILL